MRPILLASVWETNWPGIPVVLAVVCVTAVGVWILLRDRRSHAEEKLKERERTNELLAEEHARRLNAERESRRLTQRLLTAQEDERRRLARELHDDITQRLARLAIDADQIERGVPPAANNGTSPSMREELVRLSEDVHRFAYRLHPTILEELGIVEALRAECSRIARAQSIPVDVKLRDVPGEISPQVALCLFRILQESLRNVARHSHASTVSVCLAGVDSGLQLSIQDNGVGFASTRRPTHPSLGHAGMKERVKLLEGELDIESEPGHGTTVVAWVPFKKAVES